MNFGSQILEKIHLCMFSGKDLGTVFCLSKFIRDGKFLYVFMLL